MDWAAWAPAIISLGTGLVVFGGYLTVLKDHTRQLAEHAAMHKETERHDTVQDVAIAKLEAWNEGFSAAREYYTTKKDG